MTDYTDLIARLRADLDGATRGPWVAKYHDDGCEVVRLEGGFTTIADVPDYSDALFIAAARQLVPEAADAIAALQAEVARLREQMTGAVAQD